MTTLSVIEKATLQALASACDFSLGAHVPKEAVTKRVPTNIRGDARKALRKLKSKGYCFEHPTGRNKTWQLTQSGLDVARRMISSG